MREHKLGLPSALRAFQDVSYILALQEFLEMTPRTIYKFQPDISHRLALAEDGCPLEILA